MILYKEDNWILEERSMEGFISSEAGNTLIIHLHGDEYYDIDLNENIRARGENRTLCLICLQPPPENIIKMYRMLKLKDPHRTMWDFQKNYLWNF